MCITSLTHKPSDLQCLIAIYPEASRNKNTSQKLVVFTWKRTKRASTYNETLQLWARIKLEEKEDRKSSVMRLSYIIKTYIMPLWLFEIFCVIIFIVSRFRHNLTIKCQWEKPWNLRKLNIVSSGGWGREGGAAGMGKSY